MSEQQATAVEQATQQSTAAQQATLPYHTIIKDNFNKIYADRLKISYRTIPTDLRVEFDHFTHNLMAEKYINRNLLLEATGCFYTYFNHLCDATYTWQTFTDNAFNYRPYQ
jgi:hypothetical protein